MKCISTSLATAVLLLSTTQPTLAAGDNILPSTISVDTNAHTGTLPLYRGTVRGESVWYIITDTSDRTTAQRLHVLYSPELASIGSEATQSATRSNGMLTFQGTPDFSPTRTYVASADGFPPKSATPGSVGDAQYSPFVRVKGEAGVLNAPIVATGDGPFDVATHTNTEDRVLAIDTATKRVTFTLARGFVDGMPVYYISTDASDATAAAVERATYVPKLAKAQASATIPIGVIVDGPTSAAAGQGLKYLSLDTPLSENATLANAAQISAPFNVLSLVPDVKHLYAANGYSPLWSVQVVGTPQTARVTSYAAFAALGPKPGGFLVNCPVIAFGDNSGY